jgi:hypothetical protein
LAKKLGISYIFNNECYLPENHHCSNKTSSLAEPQNVVNIWMLLVELLNELICLSEMVELDILLPHGWHEIIMVLRVEVDPSSISLIQLQGAIRDNEFTIRKH